MLKKTIARQFVSQNNLSRVDQDGITYESVDQSHCGMQVASWLNMQRRPPDGASAYHDLSSAGEWIRLTQVNKRKTSSNRNLRRIMILETMRPATSTVEIASMAHVIIASPSPMLRSSGSVVGKGLSPRLTPSNMASMLAVMVCGCFLTTTGQDKRRTRKEPWQDSAAGVHDDGHL